MPRACRDILGYLGIIPSWDPKRGLIGPEPCFFAILVAAALEEIHFLMKRAIQIDPVPRFMSAWKGKIWEIYGFTMVIYGFLLNM